MVAAHPATARRLPGALTTGRYPARMPRLGPPRDPPYPGAPAPPRRRPPRWLTASLIPAVIGGVVALGGAALTGNLGGSETVIARDPTPLPVSLPAAAARAARAPRRDVRRGRRRRADGGRRQLARRGEGDGGHRRGRAPRVGLPGRFPRAHPHQRPRAGIGHARHRDVRRRHRGARRRARPRREHGPGGAERRLGPAERAAARPRQERRPGGGGPGHRHRQPLRPRAHGHDRDRLGPEAHHHLAQRLRHPERHPDRRRDQPGQLGRPAARRARPGRGHQLPDRLGERRQRRHRVRDPDRHDPPGRRLDHRHGNGPALLAGRHGPHRDAGDRQGPRGSRRARGGGGGGRPARPRRQGRA